MCSVGHNKRWILESTETGLFISKESEKATLFFLLFGSSFNLNATTLMDSIYMSKFICFNVPEKPLGNICKIGDVSEAISEI